MRHSSTAQKRTVPQARPALLWTAADRGKQQSGHHDQRPPSKKKPTRRSKTAPSMIVMPSKKPALHFMRHFFCDKFENRRNTSVLERKKIVSILVAPAIRLRRIRRQPARLFRPEAVNTPRVFQGLGRHKMSNPKKSACHQDRRFWICHDVFRSYTWPGGRRSSVPSCGCRIWSRHRRSGRGRRQRERDPARNRT